MALRTVRSLRKDREEVDVENIPGTVGSTSKRSRAQEVEESAHDNEYGDDDGFSDDGFSDDGVDDGFDDGDDEDIAKPKFVVFSNSDTKEGNMANDGGNEGYSDDAYSNDGGAFSEEEFDDEDYDDGDNDDANDIAKTVPEFKKGQLKSSTKKQSAKKELPRKKSPKRLKLPQHLSITLAKAQKLQDSKTPAYIEPHTFGQDLLLERWQNKLRAVERSAIPPEEIWQGNPKFGSLDKSGFPETLADDQELPRKLEAKLWKQYDAHCEKHAEFKRAVTQAYPSALNLLRERKMSEIIDQVGGCTGVYVRIHCSPKMPPMMRPVLA